MSATNAELIMGNWDKPHSVGKAEPVDGHPELGAIKCSCGWQCMTERKLAIKMGKLHIERAKRRT